MQIFVQCFLHSPWASWQSGWGFQNSSTLPSLCSSKGLGTTHTNQRKASQLQISSKVAYHCLLAISQHGLAKGGPTLPNSLGPRPREPKKAASGFSGDSKLVCAISSQISVSISIFCPAKSGTPGLPVGTFGTSKLIGKGKWEFPGICCIPL